MLNRTLGGWLSVVAVAVVMAFAGPAEAGKGKGKIKQARHLKACQADVTKHCAAIEPGKGAVRECLKAKEAELAAPCAKALTRLEKMRTFRAACKVDVKAQCKEVKPGKGRVAKCLREKGEAVSEGCRTRLAEGAADKDNVDDDAADETHGGASKEADDDDAADNNP